MFTPIMRITHEKTMCTTVEYVKPSTCTCMVRRKNNENSATYMFTL